jgi:hypothetical protein
MPKDSIPRYGVGRKSKKHTSAASAVKLIPRAIGAAVFIQFPGFNPEVLRGRPSCGITDAYLARHFSGKVGSELIAIQVYD